MPWLSKKERFTVLRYKAFNEKFKTAFLKNISKTKDKQYKIVKKPTIAHFIALNMFGICIGKPPKIWVMI